MSDFLGIDLATVGDATTFRLVLRGRPIADLRFIGDSLFNERELCQVLDEFYELEDCCTRDECISKVVKLSEAAVVLGKLIKKHPEIYDDAKELADLLCDEDGE